MHSFSFVDLPNKSVSTLGSGWSLFEKLCLMWMALQSNVIAVLACCRPSNHTRDEYHQNVAAFIPLIEAEVRCHNDRLPKPLLRYGLSCHQYKRRYLLIICAAFVPSKSGVSQLLSASPSDSLWRLKIRDVSPSIRLQHNPSLEQPMLITLIWHFVNG